MEWAKPLYSRSQVKAAGKIIATSGTPAEEHEVALAIVDNWRSAHSFPLNWLQIAVRRLAREVDPTVAPVQRLKRLPSIRSKLERQPDMVLTMMNDIGGCRSVMTSLDEVHELQNLIEGRKRESVLRRTYDYIAGPKDDGYRSLHFAFTYKSRQSPAWDGLRIEVQARTQMQHAWATTVEVVALFTGQKLKWGLGDADWQRFFVLMGSAIARREGTPLVPGTPAQWSEARTELRRLAVKLDVGSRLEAYSVAPGYLPADAHYYLLRLDVPGRTLNVETFKKSESQKAALEYAALERISILDPYTDVVLVAAGSIAELKRAYPNYFADTVEFQRILAEELS